MLDILIKNARVVDGTGRAIYRGHIGIQGGILRHVGREDPGGTTRVIDADGLVVAPGFIDPHTQARSLEHDVTLFDPETIGSDAPVFVDDQPAGSCRLIARSHGIVATFIRGIQAMREGQPTGALPGRVLRSTEDQAA